MRLRVLAVLTVLVWADWAQAQGPAPQDEPVRATADDAALPAGMTIAVMINGQGPFHFAIDSGSTTTLIASELADRLRLPEGRRVRVHAMGGTANLRTVKIDSIQASFHHQRTIEVAAVPRANLGADGLLGLNLLTGQRVVMDFVERTIRLEPSTAKREASAAEEEEVSEIIVTARKRRGQLVMVDADANGQKVWVIVDSGSQVSVGNLELMRLLVKRTPGIAIKPVSLTDVIGRQTAARYAFVDRLRLGGIAMGHVPIAFADAHPFSLFDLKTKPSLLLGLETLAIFRRVTIDFGTRKVTFQIANEKLGPELPR